MTYFKRSDLMLQTKEKERLLTNGSSDGSRVWQMEKGSKKSERKGSPCSMNSVMYQHYQTATEVTVHLTMMNQRR